MKFQEEIIKAQQEQILHQNLMMSNSDESIMLKSFQECLFGSPNKEEFEKSWSSDLQAKFPEGGWRTINGASVFINGGKVIAGLDGFNGAIDEYFSKKEGSKKEDGEEIANNWGNKNIKFNNVKEIDKYTERFDLRVAKPSYEKLSDKEGNEYYWMNKTEWENSKEFTPIKFEKYIKEDEPKENKEEKDEPMPDSERSLVEHYNKDRKGFIKNYLETAIRRPEEALKSLDKYIEESKNSEHRVMLKEVKQALVDKLAEPEKQKGELKSKMELIGHLLNEDKNAVDYNKLLEGDVSENFKKMREYDKLYGKVFKENPKSAVELGNLTGDVRDYEKAVRGKTATVKKKEIKVRETDTENALKSIVTTDPLRPIFGGIFHDPEGYKVAADLHSLIAVKTDIGDSAGKTINPKSKEEIEGKFVAWKSVIPQKTNGEIKMKLSDLHSLTSQVVEINKVEPISVTKIKGVDQDFDPKIINGAVESLRKLGVEDVSVLNGEDGESRPLIIKGNNKKGEEVTCLIMPMKSVENEHLMITQ